MKFTTLESFSKHLSDSVNLSALNRVPADRKTLDFAWLTWQLDWLYSYPELLSASAKNNIQHYWASAPELITLADQIRIDWVAEYGFSWQNHGSNQPRNSVTHTLLKILTQYIPNAASPSERIRDYLVSYAGLPEEKWKDISQWKLASQEHVVISKRAHLRSVESYHWLSNQELKQVLLQRPVGEQLIQTGNLNIIPLPEHLPRPASFSLPDGSLWLAWPQKARPTHLHPIVQASLVCHEAAHLVQNHMPTNRLQTGHDSIWQSEKAALQEEWCALQSFCSSQPEKLKNIFASTWWEENCFQQRDIFLGELRLVTDGGLIAKVPPSEQYISLPFLSAVYACIAEDIFSQQ